jgi:hypothetical protein
MDVSMSVPYTSEIISMGRLDRTSGVTCGGKKCEMGHVWMIRHKVPRLVETNVGCNWLAGGTGVKSAQTILCKFPVLE